MLQGRGRGRRVLYYTHNSVGIGHLCRARALISGMRQWWPDMEVLALSGSDVPHVLLREDIEVIKLPGLEQLMMTFEETEEGSLASHRSDECSRFRPRHLRSTALEAVMRLRRRIISESFRCFQPDVLLVEHYLGGLLDELMPILGTRGAPAAGRPVRVALSRGTSGRSDKLFTACGRHRVASLMRRYDLFYCFEEGGASVPADPRITFVGRMTDRCRHELVARDAVYQHFNLSPKPLILFSLCRHGDIAGLSGRFLDAFELLSLHHTHHIMFVIDPYLAPNVLEAVRKHPLAAMVQFLPFFHPLVDVINAAALVLCRAGYNTINELLLTGTKAIVIPEHHPSREQEQRVAGITAGNLSILTEQEALREPPVATITELLARPVEPPVGNFNKYDIARRVVTDLETCLARMRPAEPVAQ